MPSKPPASLLLDWITAAWALTPTTEPVAAGVLWRDNGVLTYSVGIPPVITDQPDNVSPNDGDTATFSVVATNATSYQWEINTGSGWGNISGATSASYTTGALSLSDNAHQLRLVVTGPGGTVTSNTATITMFDLSSLSSPAFIIPMTEGSGDIAYNTVGAYTSGDTNKWFAPENLSVWTLKSGATAVTDNYADYEPGDSAASRCVIPAGNYVNMSNNFRVIAGVPHTFSFYYKATTGSSTPFRSFRSGAFGALTATASWQRASVTWTPAADNETVAIYADASAESDVLIYGVMIEKAASAGTYKRPESHLRISNKPYDVVWSSSGITIGTSQQVGSIIRNAAVTVSQFTCHVAVKYNGSNTATQYGILSSKSNGDIWMKFSPQTGAITEKNVQYKSGALLGPRGTDISDGAWHIISVRYDGSTLSMYVDGCLQRASANSGTYNSTEWSLFGLMSAGGMALTAPADYAYLAWFDSAHSFDDLAKSVRYINSVIASRGVTRTISTYVVFEGDSVTCGNTYTPLLVYPERCTSALGSAVRCGVQAVSGSSISHMTSRAVDTDSCVGRTTLASNSILCVMIGTNDLSGATTAAQFISNLQAYCAARREAGWKVVVSTVPPKSDGTFNAKRATANAEIVNAAHIGVYWDAVAAWHTDSTIGIDAAGSNATYYPDGTHPSNAAHILLEPYFTAAINSLLL